MANIREYFRNKEKRDKEQRPLRISYREKIKSHKFTVFYRVTLVLLLLAAIGAVVFIQWKNKVLYGEHRTFKRGNQDSVRRTG